MVFGPDLVRRCRRGLLPTVAGAKPRWVVVFVETKRCLWRGSEAYFLYGEEPPRGQRAGLGGKKHAPNAVEAQIAGPLIGNEAMAGATPADGSVSTSRLSHD